MHLPLRLSLDLDFMTPTWPFLAKRPGGLTVMIRTTLLDLVYRARLRDWKKPTTLSVWTFELELY